MGLIVDFTPALHNRTGKYFVGRDIIDDNADKIDSVRYWRWAARQTPTGLAAKVLRRLESYEVGFRVRNGGRYRQGLARPRQPVLHIDPFTVTFHDLEPRDAVLCHDLGPVTHPQLVIPAVTALYSRAYEIIAEVGPRMTFVSQSSQKAFHALYGDRFASSRVIYNPLRSDIASGSSPTTSPIEGRYLLCVGSVGARKNQLGCIQAFAASGLAREGVSFVMCGGREMGWQEAEAAAAATPGVIRLGYVSDAELSGLYTHASGFVLASLLEGFGVPVAEAVSYGLVPLIARGEVLEEVAGPGALTADAFDTEEIAAAMRTLVSMPPQERAQRLAMMTGALSRFSREAFRDGWAAEIEEITSR